ncbi:MAG: hypothetical protein MJ252_29175 [archaeon]|nr:hypothetical protein [archaeon]
MSNLKEFIKARKTRIEALADRINEANNYVNSMLPDESGKNEELSSQKFMNKLNNILEDFKGIEAKQQGISKDKIKAEVDALPERSLLELSLAKAKLKEECQKTAEDLQQKDTIIKNLELELISRRQEIEQKRQEELKNQELITSLQQQVAVLRSKTFGYDISKKYEYYKDKQSKAGPVGKIDDENLAFAMWEKENYDNRRAKVTTSLDQLENSKDMWISSANKTGKVIKDVDLANSYNNVNGIRSNNYNYNYNQSMKNPSVNNQGGSQRGLGTNMRKYTPMIFNDKK